MRHRFNHILFICLSAVMLFFSCKEDPIPVVKMEALPAELVGLSKDTIFDTLPYTYTRYTVDTIHYMVDTVMLDSIVRDTLEIDTFSVDTFFMDTVCIYGVVSCVSGFEYGPALQEYGFVLDDTIMLPMTLNLDNETPYYEYDTFAYVLPIRYDAKMYYFTYALNPSGFIRSGTRAVVMSYFDDRK